MKHLSSIFNHYMWLLLPISAFICAQTSDQHAPELILNLKNSKHSISNQVKLEAKQVSKFKTIGVPNEATNLVFQCHCQKETVTIMYHQEWTYDSAVTATSVGLIYYLQTRQTEAFLWLNNSHSIEIDCVIAVVPLGSDDPVPGGCNIEFNVPTSPFLHLNFNAVQTTLEFQNANLGYERSTKELPKCDSSMYFISYEYYVLFLPENNYDIKQFALNVDKSLTWKSLEENTRQLNPYVKSPAKRLFFSSFPGQGVIYNIVAKYTSRINETDMVFRSAYVPYVTYGCSFQDPIDGCYSINRTFTYVFLICAAIVGAFICLAGHYYFKIQMFVVGFIAACLVTFILLIKYTTWTHTDREVLTMLMGVIGGVLWMLLWWFYGSPLLSMLLAGFELGYLFSAIIFFTPLGNLDIFRNNFNFWMTFAIGVIFIPLILIYFTRTLSIVFCSVIGSFGIVVALDRFLRATLSYIILNVVKRSIYGSMDKVNTVLPFQSTDFALSLAWAFLAISGILVQHYTTRHLPSFPPCPYQVHLRRNESSSSIGDRSRNLIRRIRNVKNSNESDPLVNPAQQSENSHSYGTVH